MIDVEGALQGLTAVSLLYWVTQKKQTVVYCSTKAVYNKCFIVINMYFSLSLKGLEIILIFAGF